MINGNNQLTLDGRSANFRTMENKTMASTVNPDSTTMSTNLYMQNHAEQMWIKKPKIRMEYKDYKNIFGKYIERSALFKPIMDTEITLNQVILNKVKKGCSFFYKCLTYKKRLSFNWNKQKAHWEKTFEKTYEDAEWGQIINSLRDIKNNNYHKEHQLRIIRNNIFTNKRLAHHVEGKTKYCEYCTDKVEDVLHHVYECPKSQYVWRIMEAILNHAGETVYIDAEHAIFGFPDQNPNNPTNTMILFAKRLLYTCKFSGVNPNINTVLRHVKEVCKIQILKNKGLGIKFPSWERMEKYLNFTWPADIHNELGSFGQN